MQIAVHGVFDGSRQPTDLRLVGGNLLLQRRVLLLKLMILRLEVVVFALGDTGRKNDSRHNWDAAFQIISHCFEFSPGLDGIEPPRRAAA